MKYLVLGLALAASGCATVESDFNAIAGIASGSVPLKSVYVAVNAFDALETTATGYLHFCRTTPPAQAQLVCSQNAIKSLIPAVRSGRLARNNLEAFVKANPGQLGPSGLFNALQSAVSTLQGIIATYNIKTSS